MIPEEILRLYGPMVDTVANRMIHNRSLAADAVQETWLQVFSSLDSFRGDSKISTWICGIAVRVTLSLSRREAVHSHEDIESFFETPKEFAIPPAADQELIVKEACDRCVTSFLRCLNPDERVIVILRDLLECSFEEISSVTGTTQAAARKSLSRGRAKLSSYIRRDCVLVNPDGNCRCHIRKAVEAVNLPEAYAQLKAAVQHVNELQLLNRTLPGHEWWKEISEKLSQIR